MERIITHMHSTGCPCRSIFTYIEGACTPPLYAQPFTNYNDLFTKQPSVGVIMLMYGITVENFVNNLIFNALYVSLCPITQINLALLWLFSKMS